MSDSPVYFRPTQTFEASPTGVRSVYLEGSIYTVRPGNVVLAAAVRDWEKKKLVTIVPDKGKGTRRATAHGKMEVR